MFLGEYTHSLDSKGRLTIPAKFRDQLAAGLVVTRNPSDKCLLLMPMPEWTELRERLSGLSIADRRHAQLRRLLFSAAEDLKPDRQGRILINPRLREYAQMDTEVNIVGVDHYIELWNPQRWTDQVLTELDSGEIDGEIFAALGI